MSLSNTVPSYYKLTLPSLLGNKVYTTVVSIVQSDPSVIQRVSTFQLNYVFWYNPLSEKPYCCIKILLHLTVFNLKIVGILPFTTETILDPTNLTVLMSPWISFDAMIIPNCNPDQLSFTKCPFPVCNCDEWYVLFQPVCWAAPMQGSQLSMSPIFLSFCISFLHMEASLILIVSLSILMDPIEFHHLWNTDITSSPV